MTKYEPLTTLPRKGPRIRGSWLPRLLPYGWNDGRTRQDGRMGGRADGSSTWTQRRRMGTRTRTLMRMQRVRILCSGCREKVAKHKSEQHEAHNKQIIERLERTNPPRPRPMPRPQSSRQTS